MEVRGASFKGLRDHPIEIFPSGLVVNADGAQAAIVVSGRMKATFELPT